DRGKLPSLLDNELIQSGCNSSEKYAIVVHGWLESIDTDWVHVLIDNLQRFRGGCIIFMDYSNHSIAQDYFDLVRKFNPLTQVLLDKLNHLETQGFNPDNLFMYGFSFGAQLVINAGVQYGFNKIAEIDGIHTSGNKGTIKRNCHQDWMMGRCGRVQEAAGPAPRGSHGLCPHFYNSAFSHDFYATENIFGCVSRRIATNIPESFKMGYTETRKNQVYGDLFSPTGECYPYNYFNGNGAIPEGRGLRKLARRRQIHVRARFEQPKCSAANSK
ncbi:CLUMA_CG018754, isoform A, partial [Clunio marinus]